MDTLQVIEGILNELSIHYRIIHHAAVFNSADVLNTAATDPSSESKSLALKIKNSIVVLTIPIEDRVDKELMKSLGLGGKYAFLLSNDVSRHLGVTVGAVPPFGFPGTIKCFVSEKFLQHEYFYLSPGLNDITIELPSASLKTLEDANFIKIV